jgi:hypothetical protein
MIPEGDFQLVMRSAACAVNQHTMLELRLLVRLHDSRCELEMTNADCELDQQTILGMLSSGAQEWLQV